MLLKVVFKEYLLKSTWIVINFDLKVRIKLSKIAFFVENIAIFSTEFPRRGLDHTYKPGFNFRHLGFTI